jgi:hypothetical protein
MYVCVCVCVRVCVPARDEIDGAAVAAKRKTRNDSVLSQYINQTLTMFLISFQQSGDRAQYTHTRAHAVGIVGRVRRRNIRALGCLPFFTSRNHFTIIFSSINAFAAVRVCAHTMDLT